MKGSRQTLVDIDISLNKETGLAVSNTACQFLSSLGLHKRELQSGSFQSAVSSCLLQLLMVMVISRSSDGDRTAFDGQPQA